MIMGSIPIFVTNFGKTNNSQLIGDESKFNSWNVSRFKYEYIQKVDNVQNHSGVIWLFPLVNFWM